MKIPRIPAPDGLSGKQWERGDNGKGSERRQPDPRFKGKEADLPRTPTPGHTRIIYKKGERIVFINGVRQ